MKSNKPDTKIVFGEALRLSVPAERAAYLERACAGNDPLRHEVEFLLAAAAEALYAEEFKAAGEHGVAATVNGKPIAKAMGDVLGRSQDSRPGRSVPQKKFAAT